MPRTIETQVYTFDELSDTAKEKARDWYRSCIESYEYECVTDDAKEIAALFGYDIDNVYWSGFCHQGQGAACEGDYSYKKGALAAVKHHAPQDEELHNIAARLQDVQRRYFYQLSAKTSQYGRYYSLSVDVTQHTPIGERYDVADAAIDGVTEALRDFSAWVYSQLDKHNDWLMSDENVDDTIICNDYEFTEDGERV